MSFEQWIAKYFPQLVGEVELLPEVLENHKRQAEFDLPPWDYIDRLATNERVIIGQKYLGELKLELNQIFDRYGASPSLLLAIWGIETNFGMNLGTVPIGSALATLAFAGPARRQKFFLAQLEYFCSDIHPLQCIRHPICGSWAGASGHMQFMPETYAKFAVSYASSQPINIWESIPDALNSAANYLKSEGLKSAHRLVIHQNLDTNIGYEWDGVHNACDAKEWANRGIEIPQAQSSEKCFFLAPAGRHGPRILLGGQALALFQYNRSVNYVLAVSKLASMIDGAHFEWTWNRSVGRLGRSQIAELQSNLSGLGFDAGVSDGIMGPDTVRAVMQAQKALRMVADGYPDLELFSHLEKMKT